MVRMQADARLPAAERLGYRHIGDALVRIAKEEGMKTYWRGATPTGEWTKGICRYHVESHYLIFARRSEEWFFF